LACRKQRLWTKKEDEFLRDRIGELSLMQISKKLGRSFSSIKNRGGKIFGVTNPLSHIDGITLNKLSKCFGVSYCWMVQKVWIEKLNIPYKTKVVSKTRAYRYVNIDEFWVWAEKNKNAIDFSSLEKNILGREPEWVDGKRRVDTENSDGKKTGKRWTKSEDEALLFFVNRNKTYCEISKKIGRSEAAIKSRLATLNVKDRPMKTDCKKWTEKEVRIMLDMYEKGYKSSCISEKLGRTAKAIESKLGIIKNQQKEANKDNRKEKG